MLTLFSTPKPFRQQIGVIQTNAIQSWLILRPECEIILIGDEEGTAEVASRFGIRHIPDVECNEYGTPLVSSVFSIAQDIANHQLMCYVNTDIILMSDFLPAVQRIHKWPFLMIGHRRDIELNEPVNFDDAQWESWLRARVVEYSKFRPHGLDYFLFPRGLYEGIPPFAIGRTGWDNWLVYWARSLKVPVIDATKAITVVHQNHDYSHHPQGKAGVWKGPEKKRNIELMGGSKYSFDVKHATFLLTPKGIRRALTVKNLYFRLEGMSVLVPRLYFLGIPRRVLVRLSKVIRSKLGIPKSGD